VFLEIREQTQMEIEASAGHVTAAELQEGESRPRGLSDLCLWRHQVLAVATEKELEDLPGVDEEDLTEWDSLVTQLEDGILHDRDFELINQWSDIPKDSPTPGMVLSGVRPEYFSMRLPLYEGSEFRRIHRALDNLIRFGEL